MTCARCHRVLTAETSVYSSKTFAWYCWPPLWNDCDRVYRARTAK